MEHNINSDELYNFAKTIYPICRSITGNGVRETLQYLKKICEKLNIFEVPSGTKVFDWIVPNEWNIENGYIITPEDKKIADFKQNNLHILGYSIPVNKTVTYEELLEHVYTLPNQPDAIPYVTSYYKERWGFCITENEKQKLSKGNYKVVIESSLKPGNLSYGEIILKGKTNDEILISTYICHPSMANDNISGPTIAIYLANALSQIENRHFTYRFVFIPETIGSLTYLSKHYKYLKQYVKAGFVLTCVGDNKTYSYIQSRYANTLADKVITNILKFHSSDFLTYSYLARGSDERQYNSPGIDLPVICFCRSKFGEFPEYHTSLDNINFISKEGLYGSFEVMWQCLETLEMNKKYKILCLGEPQLGKRGLYPDISKKGSADATRIMTNLIAYCDGSNDLIDISNIINIPIKELIPIIKKLLAKNLLTIWSDNI